MEILDLYTPQQLRKALFYLLDHYLYLYKIFPDIFLFHGKHVVETEPAIDSVAVSVLNADKEPIAEFDVKLDLKVLSINDDLDNPLSGTYLMKYGRCKELNTIFYWSIEMITNYFNQEYQNDTAQTS